MQEDTKTTDQEVPFDESLAMKRIAKEIECLLAPGIWLNATVSDLMGLLRRTRKSLDKESAQLQMAAFVGMLRIALDKYSEELGFDWDAMLKQFMEEYAEYRKEHPNGISDTPPI